MYAYFAVHAKVSKSERRQNSGRQFQYWRAGQFAFRNERHDFQFRGDTRSAADSFAQRTLGIPVFIENDTKAMAYGEYVSENNASQENVIYVNIGWGLGLCIIINGEIYYGKDGYSGEFGHIHMYENNVMCHCGKKGCIETEISGSAVCRKLVERIYNHEASVLSKKVWNGNMITIEDIIEAAKLEDPLCIELVTQAGGELGHQLAGLINLLNPDRIIIGGRMSEIAPYYFLQPVKLAVHKYSLRLMTQQLSIVPSRLGGDAGVIGACLIARKKMIWNKLSIFKR